MPKSFLFTHKRYDLYNLNIPRVVPRDADSSSPELQSISCTKIHREEFPPLVPVSRDKSSVYSSSGYNSSSPNSLSPPLSKDWTAVMDRNRQHTADPDDEPVNLSVKRIDLFNLTQLAEVSLAAAAKSQTKLLESKTEETDASSNRHVCTDCSKSFSTFSNLARHRQTHRSPTDSTAVKKCPHCSKIYVSMPAFSMHLRTHSQTCKCPYCSKTFSRAWLLSGHIRTHTGEKPFKCNTCCKAFADKSNLRAHIQTHSTEKPFICNRCGKTFALKSYLCKHIESSCMRTNRANNKNSRTDSNSNAPDLTISTCS